jgi:voltage-gated potassium channel
VSVCTVLAGAIVVWIVEPGIGGFPDAVWWAVVTATTVGYGDLAPENPLARLVAVVLMLVGIGTIGMLTGSIATYFIGEEDHRVADPEVEHIQRRLNDWATMNPQERRRIAAMLALLADQAHATGERGP